MGKNLIQQRAGRGTSTFRSPSYRFAGSINLPKLSNEQITGKITDLIDCPGHSSPLACIKYSDGEESLLIAAEGIRVNDIILCYDAAELKLGNILPLKNIPEGTMIFNIEATPGDGGKLVRSSGTAAKVAAKLGGYVTIILPSKKKKTLNGNCRAIIGVAAGGGRLEKPFLKAGKKYHKMAARNIFWPDVNACAMNAVDHPFGGSRSSRKGRPTIAPRNAPPGRKVGMLRPRSTGRAK